VRKARSRRDGTDWAVKVIDKGKLDKEDEEALRVEVAILQRVEHPNIVHLRQVFDTPKTFYMVRRCGDVGAGSVAARRRHAPMRPCPTAAATANTHPPVSLSFPQVMELMTGGELFDRIVAKSKYSEAEAAATIAKIADALVYCHKRGIVHRCVVSRRRRREPRPRYRSASRVAAPRFPARLQRSEAGEPAVHGHDGRGGDQDRRLWPGQVDP